MATYGDLTAADTSAAASGGASDGSAQLNAVIKSDPELQRLIKMLASGDTTGTTGVFDNPATKITQRLKDLGLTIPKGSWLSEGEIKKNPNTFLTRALPIMAAVATAGIGLGALGPSAAFLTGGGAAAAGGAPALAAGVPTAIGGASALGGGSAALGAAPALASGASAAAPSAGGGFGHFVSSLFGGPSGLVSAGLGAAGMLLNNKASGDATAAQLKAQQEALKAQIDMYNQQTRVKAETYNNTQANLAPYQGLGKGAASLAGYGLGIPGYETGNTSVVSPKPSQQIDPGTIQYPGSGGSTPAGAAVPRTPSAMVSLKAPDGSVQQVPANQADHYKQLGAVEV